MARYWVVGGEYADTEFRRMAAGKAEERLGPYATYAEAHRVWAGKAWTTVDDCHTRYRIVAEES